MMRVLLLIGFLTASLFAANGELSLYILKDGKPLPEQTVLIYKLPEAQPNEFQAVSTLPKAAEFLTDKEGYLTSALPQGKYQLQVVAKEEGIAQAFVKKNFIIAPAKQTQIILALKNDNTLAFADTEAPEELKEAVVEDTKKLVNGTVALTLLSSEDDTPVSGARIFVPGLKIDAVTNDKGQVVFDVPEGNRTLSIIHTAFSSQNVKVDVLPNEMTMKTIELSPASMELEEFVVLAPHVEGSIAAMIAEEKNSESIANIVGSEQMRQQGDSNAASALKRIAGITVIGGKDIYVRGLGDRYSSTELNGMALPSPNPIKRTVPLDMFPAGVIGSLQVQKTFTPDITGAFGGGYVNVRTKKSAPEDYAQLKVGAKMHSSYGDEVTTYQGSGSDWTGYDNSYRPFPQWFTNEMLPVVGEAPPTLTQSDAEMQKLYQGRNIDPQKTNVPLGKEIAVEFAQNFEFGDEHELSILANYGYKTESKLVKYTSYDYLISSSGEIYPTPDNTVENNLYRTNIQHGGIVNAAYTLHNFDMRYTLLYVLNTLDQTRDVNGTFGENNSKEHQYYFEWQERELFINQLTGGLDYDIGLENRFDFGAEIASASEYAPNDVYYNYKKYFANGPYVFERPDSQLTYNHRTTDDKLYNLFVKNQTMLPILSEDDYIEVGAVTESKKREGRRVEITMQSKLRDDTITSGPISDTINYGDGSDLSNDLTSRPKDQYDAKLNRNAVYLKGLIKPWDNVDITYGGRYVDLEQSVDQYKTEQNVVAIENYALKFNKFLPSVGLRYALTEDHQFRLAYSETFIYPDFREFVNAEFIHPVFLAKVSGNPDLVETDIQNFDFRYDWYFSETDNVSLSLFYKYMKNPIEDTQEFTTGTLPRFSFDNSESADLSGVEFSFYTHLDYLHDALENFIISGNYTYIDSKVQLTEAQKEKFVTQDRGLQGLSPQVINLSFTYDLMDVRSINLSFNKMDKRLMRVALKNGDVILGLDDYEIPPNLLDFTWIERFRSDWLDTDMAATLKVRNILDDKTKWEQGGKTTLEYKTGREYSLSVSAKF